MSRVVKEHRAGVAGVWGRERVVVGGLEDEWEVGSMCTKEGRRWQGWETGVWRGTMLSFVR
jgi:hypothetical protein